MTDVNDNPNRALALLFGLRLENGAAWREVATDWQLADARAVLAPAASDPRLHFLTRPRGASKTSDISGIALSLLLEILGPGDQGHIFAVDADQAAEVVRAAAGFVARTGELRGLVDVQTRKISTPNGASFVVVPADAASAYGIRSKVLIFDEFCQLGSTPEPKRLWEAAFSAQPKLNALLVLLSTAGDPSSWQAKVRDLALSSSRWRVDEVPGPCPWTDRGALDEQRRILTESQYGRLHENRWLTAEDRLTSVEAVRECVRHDDVLEPRANVKYWIGLDIGVVRDRTAIAVAHAERGVDGPTVVVDRVVRFIPSKGRPVDLAEVEETVFMLSRSYNRAHVKADPYQAILMAQGLRRRGVQIEQFTFSQSNVGRLALNLYRLFRGRRIALPNDELLLDELASVQLREVGPNTFRMDHAAGAHDDQAIAVGLCAIELAGERQAGPAHSSAQVASRRSLPATPTSLVGGDTGVATPGSYAERVARRRGWRVQTPEEQYPLTDTLMLARAELW